MLLDLRGDGILLDLRGDGVLLDLRGDGILLDLRGRWCITGFEKEMVYYWI